MAFVYQKTVSDKTVIFGGREQMARQFDFGTDWTEIRIGMFWSPIALTDPNTAASVEDVPIATVLDRFFFGLKNPDSSCPGQAGSLFVGISNEGTQHSFISTAEFSISDTNNGRGMGVKGYVGTTAVSPAGSIDAMVGVTDPTGANAYCNYVGLRFVLANRGLSSQTIKVSASLYSGTGIPVAGSDYSAAALRTLLSAFAHETAQITINWNDGANAYDIPDAWFLRNPFFNNRIRVSCMDAIKVAP